MTPKKRSNSLTLQFIPHADIESLSSIERINKLLKIVKEEKIILLEGSLKPIEEAELIKKTMEEIDDSFKGIEISQINIEEKNKDLFKKIKDKLIKILLGNRQGLTIIGPATIVKEIKQDPDKIQLFTETQNQQTHSSKKKH